MRYEVTPPPARTPEQSNVKVLYVHGPTGRKGRKIDDATETFVDQSRMGAG